MKFKMWLEFHDVDIDDLLAKTAHLKEPKKPSNWSQFYIEPDVPFNKIHSNPEITPFIYMPDGTMHYGYPDEAHSDIGVRKNILSKTGWSINGENIHRPAAENHILFGRIGFLSYDHKGKASSDLKVVSFWGNNPQNFDTLLPGCLKKLAADGLIDLEEDAISTPNHQTILIRDLFKAPEISNAEKVQQNQKLALHLMSPQQKMNQLKSSGWQPKKNAWQDASDKIGITTPGKRLWALNSEGSL